MAKSPLDYDFSIGLDDVEEHNQNEASIFDEPLKSKKELEAERKRQHENLKRYVWVSGKVGAFSLRHLGGLLVWVGNKSKMVGQRLDIQVAQIKPRKRSLKKDVAKAVGLRLVAKKRRVAKS